MSASYSYAKLLMHSPTQSKTECCTVPTSTGVRSVATICDLPSMSVSDCCDAWSRVVNAQEQA